MMFLRKKKISLILPGGGIKCASQLGPLIYLKERGIPVELITAVSAGTINAAKFAEGLDELKHASYIWKKMTKNGIYKRWLLHYIQAFWKGGIYSREPLENLLRSTININKINESDVKLFIGAVSKMKKKMRWWDNVSEMGFYNLDPFIASCSFPVFFPPKEINKRLYFDGGMIDPIPFQKAFDEAKKTKHFIVLRTTSEVEENLLNQSEDNDLKENFELTFDYGHKAVIDAQTEILNRESKKRNIIIYKPKRKYFTGTFDANIKRIDYCIEDSYEHAKEFFKKLI